VGSFVASAIYEAAGLSPYQQVARTRARSDVVPVANHPVCHVNIAGMQSSQIQSRLERTYLASCLVALRWEIFGALGTVGTVLYVLGETFSHIVWSVIAGVTVALLIATFREAMTWLRCAP
jgi:hypothetical protein